MRAARAWLASALSRLAGAVERSSSSAALVSFRPAAARPELVPVLEARPDLAPLLGGAHQVVIIVQAPPAAAGVEAAIASGLQLVADQVFALRAQLGSTAAPTDTRDATGAVLQLAEDVRDMRETVRAELREVRSNVSERSPQLLEPRERPARAIGADHDARRYVDEDPEIERRVRLLAGGRL